MAAAVSVVWLIAIFTLVPLFTKSFFTIKEDEPVSHLRLFFSTAKHSSDLEQGCDRRRWIVRAHKIHVLKKFRIVVARDQDQFIVFTRDLADDVCHLLCTVRRGGGEFVQRYVHTVRLQLVQNVSACFGELRAIRRPWSKIDLLAHVVHRSFAVEDSGGDGRRRSPVTR